VFCRKIPAVCAFLGSTVTSECILPFLENALVDNEERVVAQSVRCITTLVQLKLLSRLMTVDAVRSGAPLLLHPRPTIRQAAIALVEAAASAHRCRCVPTPPPQASTDLQSKWHAPHCRISLKSSYGASQLESLPPHPR
jgi:hypothetical protein